MNRVKGLLVALGVSTVAVLAVACGNGEAATTAAPNGASPAAVSAPAPASGGASASVPGNQPAQPAPAVGAPEPTKPAVSVLPSTAPPAPPVPASEPAAVRSVAVSSASGMAVAEGAYQLQPSNGQAGIWVSGQGKITLEPDLALLNLGVEANEKTVAAAREVAATAMDAIVASLTANGVAENDIQTRFFNISPQYEWTEVIENGIRSSKQVLVGYRVSNSAAVKIRDMSAVGTIIDEVAVSGGDATRINGISFTVEDTAPFMVDLREDAVADALAKADQFARLTGVSLGRLVFISEVGGGQPQVNDFRAEGIAMAMAAPAPSTSISGGELEISLAVQAVFAIQ